MLPTPYPGLRPFQPDEAEVFFGREQHTDRLLEILQRERFLAVIGPSGCGKSSLVRAGLLPALAAGWLGTGSAWRMAVLRPGDRPFHRLAESLLAAPAFGPELSEPALTIEPLFPGGVLAAQVADTPQLARGRVEAELRRGPLGLVHLADSVRTLSADRDFNLLVLVDQFEELFTYATAHHEREDASEAFVDLLLQSRLAADARIYVAMTMRTDFLGHCVRFLDLPEAINRGQYLIPRLKRSELSSAICGPAGIFGGSVEPTLAEELVNAVSGRQDELPLLQHVLNRMWDLARSSPDAGAVPTIGWAHYNRVGGVTSALSHPSALSQHADAIFSGLSAGEKRIAEQIFRSITERRMGSGGGQEVRRPQTLAQIAAATRTAWQAIAAVVERFAGEGIHFLVPIESPASPGSVVDISHEALIRQWQRLKIWVREEAERAADYRRWATRATDYESGGELLVGADLARASEWRDGMTSGSPASSAWRPTREWAYRYALVAEAAEAEFTSVLQFIDASEQAEQARTEAALEAERQRRRLQDEHHEALARALRAEAQVERERADAAALQRAEAEKHAKEYLAQKLEAERLWRLAEERAVEARARQTATEALQHLTDDPDRGQLLAVLAYELAALPAIELVLRQAFVRGQGLRGVLRGHSGAVRGGRFSADGRRLVTIGSDSTARVWDAGRAVPVSTLTIQDGTILSAVMSRDATEVLTACDDGTARIWDASTGELRLSLGHGGAAVIDAMFAPDGETLLTATRSMSVRRWNRTSGAELEILARDQIQHRAPVLSGAFSASGRILTASADGTARLWDAASGDFVFVLAGHRRGVNHAAFSPDGRLAVTCSDDGTARLWGVATGREHYTLRGHTGHVRRAVFSPDGARVLTGSADGTARLWDAATGTELLALRGHIDAINDVAYSHDGALVATASADETVRVWRVDSGRQVCVFDGHTGAVSLAAFSPDSRQVLSVAWDGELMLWNTAHAYVLLSDRRSAVSYAAFSLDGTAVITGGRDGTIRQWDFATGEALTEVRLHSQRISRIAFATHSDLVLTTSYDGTAAISRLSSGTLVRRLEGHSGAILDGALSADGSRALTVGVDNSVRLWPTSGNQDGMVLGSPRDARLAAPSRSNRTGRFAPDGRAIVWTDDVGPSRVSHIDESRLSTVAFGHEPVRRAEISGNGTAILTVGYDGTARGWRAADGLALGALEESGIAIRHAIFSPDGSRVLTVNEDGTLRLWEPAEPVDLAAEEAGDAASPRGSLWRPGRRLYGHTAEITAALVSPDNQHVVCGGANGSLWVWDVASGQSIGALAGHSDVVRHIEFAPNATDLLTTSNDGTARLWRIVAGIPLETPGNHEEKLASTWFSADGEQILTAGQDATPLLWKASEPGRATELIGHQSAILGAAFHSDGGMVMTLAADGTARVWDATSGRALHTLGDPPEDDQTRPERSARDPHDVSDPMVGLGGARAVFAGAFTADGARVLIADASSVHVWDIAKARRLSVILAEQREARRLVHAAFRSDAATAVTVSDDGSARLWSIERGAAIANLSAVDPKTGRDRVVTCVGMSGDERVIATGSADGGCHLWDAAIGQSLCELKRHDDQVLCVAFSPDGARVATGGADRIVRLWETRSGLGVATLRGHGDAVSLLAFSPDGRTLATASHDQVIVWEVTSGRMLLTLRGHSATLAALAFRSNGRQLITAGYDGTVRLWDCRVSAPPEELSTLIRERIGRSLSIEERVQSGLLEMPRSAVSGT